MTSIGESHFIVSLIVRDKVKRQYPKTTTFLKRKESRSGIEPRPFCLPAQSLTAGPNGLTGRASESHNLRKITNNLPLGDVTHGVRMVSDVGHAEVMCRVTSCYFWFRPAANSLACDACHWRKTTTTTKTETVGSLLCFMNNKLRKITLHTHTHTHTHTHARTHARTHTHAHARTHTHTHTHKLTHSHTI